MAIKRSVKVVIANEASKLEENIYVYQHDRGVDLTFDILENKFSFTGTQSENIVRANEIMYAGLTIKKPSGEGFFRPVLPIEENKVIFRIEHKHTDDFDEIGMYQLQIHLYDKFDNRISIPPFNLEVKPLIIDGIDEVLDGKTAIIDQAIVDISTVGEDKELFIIEHIDGESYVKTQWKAGDVITASKMNNIEQGLERVSLALENIEIPSIEGLVNEEFVATSIENAIDGLATEEFVEEAIASATESLAEKDYVDEQIANLNIEDYAKTEEVEAKIQDAINDIEIPSIDGLATEEYVNEQIANIDIPETDLSNLATKEELNLAKEELQDTIDNIEIPSIDGLATESYVDHYVNEKIGEIEIPEVDLSNHYTKNETYNKNEIDEALSNVSVDLSEYYTKGETYNKEEIDKLIPILDDYAPSKIVGRFGDSQYFHSEKRFIPEGEALLDFEPKHIFQFTYFDSSNYKYVTFYFKCDLDNDPDKYISMDNRKITLNGMTRDIDYVAISGKGSNPTGLQTFTFNETYRISALDFNIYNTDRSTILIPNPKKAGLNSFNDATTTGIYTIDLPSSSYKTLTGNAPLKSNANTVSGILEVMEIGTNIVQRKTLHSIGEQYVRILGQEWHRVDGNKINENIAQIKIADIQPIPSIAMSAPKNPFFWNDSTGGYIVFRVKENEYYAIYPYQSTKPLSCYLDNTWVSKYGYNIGFNNSYRETAVFKCADGQTWKSIDNIVSTDRIGEIKYDPDYFRVYCNSHTIYAHPNNGSIYQEPTEMEVNIPITLQDFNEAKTTGTYEIDIKEGDEILNAPISGELKGALLVHIAGTIITQEITDINRTVYKRVYNGAEWTDWKSIGEQEINLDDFYTKEEIDEKLIKKSGIIKSGDPNFKEPVWDVLPTSTFINIPANPDPATYKWEMKCSHNGYHMVFYFPKDPTGKFGIVKRSDGKLGFKLLDRSFKYTTYKSYYKEKNTLTGWSNMPSDNHFTNPDSRILEAIYSHNFDIVDGNNPEKVFRYGSQNDFNTEFISDFDIATEYETYTVEATADSIIGNSPINGAYKGILKVYYIDKIIHQELELKNGKSYKRMLDSEWTEWKSGGGSDIDPSNYYTKEETMSAEEIREALASIDIPEVDVNLDNYYTKGETYNKEEVDSLIPSTEHLASKEELENAINNIDIPEIDLSNYYTKKEVDTLTNPYKGVIGEDPHPAEFKSAPPMLETEGSYIRCSSGGNVSRVHYFEKTDKLITSDSQGTYYNGCYVWGLPSNKRIFQYNKATSTWDLVENDSYARIQAKNVDILDSVYSSNVDLYMDMGSTLVVPAKPGDPATAPYNTYNLEEAGEYKVSHNNAIEGCYKDNFNGSLVVRNINGDIYQELTSDDCSTKVIRAKIGGVWTEWKSIGGGADIDISNIDLSNYYTKGETYSKAEVDEALASIDIPEVDLDDYYNKSNLDLRLGKMSKTLPYFSGILTSNSNNLVRPITQAKLDELRPNEDYKAVGIIVNGTTYLAFYLKDKITPMYYLSGGKYGLRVQSTRATSHIYILSNNEWVKQDSSSADLYDIILPSAISRDQIYLAETGIKDTMGYMYGNRFLADAIYTNYSNIICDGIYRVTNYTSSSPSLPEANGVLELVTELDFRRLTFYTKTKTYTKYQYLADSGNGKYDTDWRETGDKNFDITNYYTKTQTDSAISSAIAKIDMPEIDLSAYSTTEQTTALINEIVGAPKAQLIDTINEMVEIL